MVKMKSFYRNKRILITVATGFKGAWFCQILDLFGSKILGVGYKPNKNQNLFNELKLNKRIKIRYSDIRDYKKLKKIINFLSHK